MVATFVNTCLDQTTAVILANQIKLWAAKIKNIKKLYFDYRYTCTLNQHFHPSQSLMCMIQKYSSYIYKSQRIYIVLKSFKTVWYSIYEIVRFILITLHFVYSYTHFTLCI